MVSSHKQTILLSVALLLVGMVLYGFNMHNGLFWDDDDWIVHNPSVHNITWDNVQFWFTHNTLAGIGLQSNYYRPFLFFTFALNYELSGIQPFSYHFLSNAIHIVNAILIFFLFSQGLNNKRIGFLTALLFLIHPIATEAVTYIAGRGDPLYVFFTLIGLLLFYMAEIRPLSWLSWQKISSILCLVLGLLSREVAMVFPFLALLISISFLERGSFFPSILGSLRRTWPYFLVVFIYGILRLTVLNFDNTLNFYATPNVYSENLHVRLFTFLRVLVDYVQILVIPIHLHMERGVPIYLSLFQWPIWFVALLLIAGGYGLFRLYKRTSGGPLFRLWFFAIGWFFVALGPVSGITPINAQLYEHWLYLPAVSVFLLFAYYFDQLLTFLAREKKIFYYLAASVCVMYVVWLSYQSIQRNILWGKPIEFYEDILHYEPDSVRINNNLGNKYYDKGDIIKAEFYYQRAVASEDIFPQPHYNLGTILQARGDIRGAIVEYEKAIAINQNFHYPYQNIAVIYANQGDFGRARTVLEQLLKIRPTDPAVYHSLALVLNAQGDTVKALEYATQGLAYASEGTTAHDVLTQLLTQLRKKL